MRNAAPIIGIILGVVFTPVALLLGIASGGAGHGDYFLAKLLFPLTMISTVPLREITPPFIFLAIVQYPIYGWFIGSALLPGARRFGLRTVLVIHFMALALNFIIPNPFFGR